MRKKNALLRTSNNKIFSACFVSSVQWLKSLEVYIWSWKIQFYLEAVKSELSWPATKILLFL